MRGTRLVTPRRVRLLPRPGGWAGGHLQDMSPPRRAPASGGLAPHLPSARGHSPSGCSPVPVTPSRFPLGAAPRGAGPRCWPGGFWSEAQSLCFVFGGGTRLTVLSKRLSALPRPVSPSALSGKSLLLLWGRLPLCPPGLKGRSPPFSVGWGWEAGWSWGNQQEPPESYRPTGPIRALGLGFGPGMQGLVPLCGSDAGVRARVWC